MPKGKKRCEFCGRDSEQYLFAAHVCNSEDCIEKAMERRGGPGGHIAEKLRKGKRMK
jgi:hypothetical protein